MGLVFPSARIGRADQERALRKAGAQWIVQVGADVPTWQEPVREVEPGSVVYIYGSSLVPAARRRLAMSRPAQWATFQAEVHGRGGHIVEVVSGRRSDRPRDLREINEEAVRLFRQGGAKLPASSRDPGRPAHDWPSPEIKAEARRIWGSPDYATRAAAIRHMPAGVTSALVRKLGPRGPLLKRRK